MRVAIRRSTSLKVAIWWGDIEGEIHSKMAKKIGLKIYKEIKPHSSEESEDKVVEVERDNYNNDDYVYYLLMERAPARSRGWNGWWGRVVGR